METQTVETPAAAQPPATPVEPSASEPSARPDFASFHEARTAKALGREPQAPLKPAVTPPPAAEPAPQGEDAPAVDAKGQPITENGKPLSKRQHAANERIRTAIEAGLSSAKADYERRIAELEARIAQPKPAEPVAQPKADDGPPKPKMADFEAKIGAEYPDYASAVEAFHDARDAWKDEQAARTAEKRKAEETKTADETAHDDRLSKHYERERAFVEKTPDYLVRVKPFRDALDTRQPLTQALLESEHSAALILHLAEHPDDLARIGVLGATNLPAALRELGKLEAKLESPAAPAPAAVPSKKTVTSAPEAPTTLGTRPAEPADAEKAAVASGNFRAFHEGRTARDLARAGRR